MKMPLFDLVWLNFGPGAPNSDGGRHVETSVNLSVSASASKNGGSSAGKLGRIVFLTRSEFASFYTRTTTHTHAPLASCASGGMM
jgi:hypothetical protein